MEERIGASISDLPDEDPEYAISGDEDLLAFASQNSEVLEELILNEMRKEGARPFDRLTRNVELLRKFHY